jgi:hypothetical protein
MATKSAPSLVKNSSENKQSGENNIETTSSVSQSNRSGTRRILLITGLIFGFILFGIVGYSLSIKKYSERQNYSDFTVKQKQQDNKNLTTTPNTIPISISPSSQNPICDGPQLAKKRVTGKIIDEWKNQSVLKEDNKIVYREVYIPKNILCTYYFDLLDDVERISNLQLHELKDQLITYIDIVNKIFHIFNIKTKDDITIPLGEYDSWLMSNDGKYEVYYEGSMIIVVPDIFFAGCPDINYPPCAEYTSKYHEALKDVLITVSKIDGSYFQINRSDFPDFFDFKSIEIDRVNNKIIFNTQNEYASYNLNF